MLKRALWYALPALVVSAIAFAAAGPTNYAGIFGAGLHGSPNALVGCTGATPDTCALGVTPHDKNGAPNDATHPVYHKAVAAADVCADPNVAKSSAVINIGAAATTKVVDTSTTTVIYACGVSASTAGTATTVTWKTGTHASADCDTGAASLTGAFNLPVAGTVHNMFAGHTLFKSSAGGQLCVTTVGSGGTYTGVLTYVQQ